MTTDLGLYRVAGVRGTSFLAKKGDADDGRERIGGDVLAVGTFSGN